MPISLKLYYIQLGLHGSLYLDKAAHRLQFQPTLDAISGGDVVIKKFYKSIAQSNLENINTNGTLGGKVLDSSQLEFVNQVSDTISKIGVVSEHQSIFIAKLNSGSFDGLNVAEALLNNTHVMVRPTPEMVQFVVEGVRNQQDMDNFMTFCEFVSRNEILSFLVVSHKGTVLFGGLLLLQSVPLFLSNVDSFLSVVVSAYDRISYNCTKISLVKFFKFTPKNVHVASTFAISSGLFYSFVYGNPAVITTAGSAVVKEAAKDSHLVYGAGHVLGRSLVEFQKGVIAGYYSAMGENLKTLFSFFFEGCKKK